MRPEIESLRELLGDDGLVVDETARRDYEIDERRLYRGHALAVARPADRDQLQRVMQLCYQAGVGMVPQGGNTGYCGGATPGPAGDELVISLERFNKIIEIDEVGMTMTVQAGVTLHEAQLAAEQCGLLFPLSMGSEMSCQIGGNVSTNAGGLAVLRYGNTRDLVLGLGVVLPDGRYLQQLKGLRKDNTGYDLTRLFVGAEGTLGIVTEIVVKLFPRPAATQTLWFSINGLPDAAVILAALRRGLGDNVTSFEYMSAQSLQLVAAAFPEFDAPLGSIADHQVLCNVSSAGDSGDERLAEIFTALTASGQIGDVVIAQNTSQSRALWAWRENIPAAERIAGGSIKHDVSVRLSEVAGFNLRASAAVTGLKPDARLSVYGHVGDGNVHFNVLAPTSDEDTVASFKQQYATAISDVVHDIADDMGGSFSAEHGVGQLKRELLSTYAGEVELELMQSIKQSLDPRNLMNPGKLI